MSDKTPTAFRIPDPIKERLKAEAKKQDVSMCYLVKTLLNKHLPKL